MPDIAIWNRCNSHCVMCTNPKDYQEKKVSISYTYENIKKRWGNRHIDPDDNLSITGGEPTIHPDFFKIIRWFREECSDQNDELERLINLAIDSGGRTKDDMIQVLEDTYKDYVENRDYI